MTFIIKVTLDQKKLTLYCRILFVNPLEYLMMRLFLCVLHVSYIGRLLASLFFARVSVEEGGHTLSDLRVTKRLNRKKE